MRIALCCIVLLCHLHCTHRQCAALPHDSNIRISVVSVNVRQPSEEKFLAVVYNRGIVTVVNKFTYHVPCTDQSGTRSCKMTFGSWTYDGLSLDLQNRTSDIDLSVLQRMTKYTVS